MIVAHAIERVVLIDHDRVLSARAYGLDANIHIHQHLPDSTEMSKHTFNLVGTVMVMEVGTFKYPSCP